MSDEKNLNEELEETTEAVEAAEEVVEASEAAEEAVEETAEEAAEVAEEATEEAVEATEVAEEAVEAAEAEEVAEADAEPVVWESVQKTTAEAKKPFPVVPVVVGAVVAVVVIALIVLGIVFGPQIFNKYNKEGYIDVSGRTIADVAESSGMELADFLEEYGLPADMPANTSESAAYYTIPCSKMAEMYGMDFETLKSTLEFPDTITEDTTWGEAEGEVRLSVYVGEDNLDSFKEQYNLGDEVTGDTQWKEIRNTVDEYARQQRLESEKAAKEAESSSADAVDDTAANADAAASADTAGAAADAGAAEKAE